MVAAGDGYGGGDDMEVAATVCRWLPTAAARDGVQVVAARVHGGARGSSGGGGDGEHARRGRQRRRRRRTARRQHLPFSPCSVRAPFVFDLEEWRRRGNRRALYTRRPLVAGNATARD